MKSLEEKRFVERVKRKLRNLENHPENMKYAKRDRDFIAYFIYLVFGKAEMKQK